MNRRSRIRVLRERYFVNDTFKTVTCVLECSLQFHKHPKWGYLRNSGVIRTVGGKFTRLINNLGEFKVSATAKCAPNDKFDETLGRRIAESKAKIKAFRLGTKVHNCIAEEYKKIADSFDTTAAACKASLGVENTHLQKLNDESCI